MKKVIIKVKFRLNPRSDYFNDIFDILIKFPNKWFYTRHTLTEQNIIDIFDLESESSTNTNLEKLDFARRDYNYTYLKYVQRLLTEEDMLHLKRFINTLVRHYYAEKGMVSTENDLELEIRNLVKGKSITYEVDFNDVIRR